MSQDAVTIQSFDVFDTLLTRNFAAPRDLYVELGLRLRDLGLVDGDAMGFAALRRDTEHALRKGNQGETKLEDIHAALATKLGWTPEKARRSLEEEIATEEGHLFAVPAMRGPVTEARKHCGRVLFISDMYLPSSVLRRWLDMHGFWAPGDSLYVSGEAGTGKSAGLFQLVAEREKLAYPSWEHQGDNPVADLRRPAEFGIRTKARPQAVLSAREKTLRGSMLFAPPWRSLVAGAARRARLLRPLSLETHARGRQLWDTGAGVAGPLLFGFVQWTLREARRRGLGKLYFLGRDGQILWRIACELAKSQEASPELHYLPSSRLAFAGASQDEAVLTRLAKAPLPHHSARQALTNLNLPCNADFLPDWLQKDDFDRNLEPAERERLADWLLAPEHRPLLRQALAQRSGLAKRFLLDSGFGDGSGVGLVDTGWSGTIQHNIELLLGSGGGPAKLTGFYLGLLPLREVSCAGECLGYTNRFRRLPLRRETTHLILLELFCRGDHGPLLGFEEREGRLSPKFGYSDPLQEAEARLFQEAVMAFTRSVLAAGAAQRCPDEELATCVLDGYLDFFHHPTLEEVLVWGRTPHANQMLEKHSAVLAPDMKLHEVLRAIADFHQRPPGWWLAGQARLGHAGILALYQLAKKGRWGFLRLLKGTRD